MEFERKRRVGWSIAQALAFSVTFGCGALAADAADMPGASAGAPSLWQRDTLTGDWGGLRTALREKGGTEITLDYIGETFGVVAGGVERRGSYEGRLELSVDSDLDKWLSWRGASAHLTLYNIHDGGATVGQHAGSIADPSNIDALSSTRLFTAWLEQSLFDGRFSVRAGQLAADDEFATSPTAAGLVNGTFGWPGLLAADMTNGGPAYPLASPGIRVKARAADRLTFLAAAFAGDPAGRNCDDDPQQCNRHGTRFPLTGSTLWMGEMQVGTPPADGAEGFPGIYKLGAWYSNGRFGDQRYGRDGAGAVVPLSDPAADRPFDHKGNWGLYGVVDQTVWRGRSSSLSMFLRGGVSPSSRNLISTYADAGFGLKGPLTGRPDDLLALGVAWAKISPDAVAADRDAAASGGQPVAVRRSEVAFELSYTAQMTPWWTLQPDLQYIVHPNGGQNPEDSTRRLGNAFVVGLRTTIKF